MMTAKFTRDGAPPVARVVREGFVGYPFGTTPWVVGCGYAARATAFTDARGEIVQPIVIVRLSDGAAHFLDTTSTNKTGFSAAIGLTCDELFLRGNEIVEGKQGFNVFRVRLDSLGPDRLVPLPPDAGN
jgi:hypothetical protein